MVTWNHFCHVRELGALAGGSKGMGGSWGVGMALGAVGLEGLVKRWEGRRISSMPDLVESVGGASSLVSLSSYEEVVGASLVVPPMGLSSAKRRGEASRARRAEASSRKMARATFSAGFWYSYCKGRESVHCLRLCVVRGRDVEALTRRYLYVLNSPKVCSTRKISRLSERFDGRGTMRTWMDRGASARRKDMAATVLGSETS